MKVTLNSTTKLVELNGIMTRIWEGETDTGIKVHAYLVRIAIDKDEPQLVQMEFERELKACSPPSVKIDMIPGRMIL